MAFDSLTDKLQNVFRKLRSKGTITEADVRSKACAVGGGCKLQGRKTVYQFG